MSSQRVDPARFATSFLRSVFGALTARGARARLVGGCVRNALLAQPVGDLDIAIDRPPDVVTELLEAAKIKVVPIGIAFGTVQAVSPDGKVVEITSLRREITFHGRHPVVEFGTDWEEDARRRDFTMNAVYADPNGTLHDPLNGIPDILVRRVRFIGDVETRIREDPLRILRYFRFLATIEAGAPDPGDVEGCGRLAELIEALSPARIGSETCKLLGSGNPSRSLKLADASGVLGRVFCAPRVEGIERLIEWESQLQLVPDWRRRWLLVEAGEPADSVRRLCIPRRLQGGLNRRRQALESAASALEIGYRQGEGASRDALMVRAVRNGCTMPPVEGISVARRGAQAKFPLQASHLLENGWEPGPGVGVALGDAERHWLAENLAPGREQLLDAVRNSGT